MSMQLSDKGLRSDINVTPLVDVMLVLLIIFMVITPMLQRGKAVQLPQVSDPEKQGDTGKDIVVSVEYMGKAKADPNIWVSRDLVPRDALKDRIEDETRRDSTREVYLKGDSRLTYGQMRDVMQIIHEAGLGQVRLATEQLKGAKK